MTKIFATYNLNLEGCESESSDNILIPFNFTFPVKGMLNRSSSSASLSTNCRQNDYQSVIIVACQMFQENMHVNFS